MAENSLTIEKIFTARLRIGNRVRNTPLSYALNLSRLLDLEIFLKLENLQVTGSFKERGAANKLLTLSQEQRRGGVVAASAGNHAQGVALHATKLGIPCIIVMPEQTPLLKITRTKRYGAEVVQFGANFDEAAAYAKELCEREGRTMVHAFDDFDIIAGQGTVGLEMYEANPDLDVVLVPIGGGGLISGIATAMRAFNPKITIIGVQTSAMPSMARSLASGERSTIESARTLADGIALRAPGVHTFPIVQKLVDEVLTVSDNDIARGVLMLLEEEKVVAEGAAAAALAALFSPEAARFRGKKIGVVVSGGNIDTNIIANIIERGLVQAGRRAQLEISISDRPGSLATLTRIIGEEGASIIEIRHERAFANVSVGETDVVVELETRGPDAIVALRERLVREGFQVIR